MVLIKQVLKIVEIELENYKGIEYLKIDNLGDLVLLIGKNGSGKSTIIRALSECLNFLNRFSNNYPRGVTLTINLDDDRELLLETINNKMNNSSNTIRGYPNVNGGSLVSYDSRFNDLNYVSILEDLEFLEFIIHENKIKLCNEISKPNYADWLLEWIKKSNRRVNIDDANDYFTGVLIGAWLRSRNNDRDDKIPSYSFLDTETQNSRDVDLKYGEVEKVGSQRISGLYDQDIRVKSLGTRLAALSIEHHANLEDDPNYSKIHLLHV